MNMLIVMSFVACLADKPTVCRVVEMPGEGTMQECQLAAQGVAAEWQIAHPHMRVVSLRCGPPERAA